MQSNNNKEEPVPPERYGLPMPLRFDHLTRVMNAIGTIWIFCIMPADRGCRGADIL
ncbi:MAG: hypothetical protein IPK23_10790 [Rhizobiales bacterium]|nr:hypothetical protein [Hyphomicrobiales bacterium]